MSERRPTTQRARTAASRARELMRRAPSVLRIPSAIDASRLNGVRTSAVRVAVAATLILAAAYLVIAASLYAIVSHNLTASIDRNLEDYLTKLSANAQGASGPLSAPSAPQFGLPFIVWDVSPERGVRVLPAGQTASLPVDYTSIGSPQTLTVTGTTTDARVAGMSIGDDYVVAGQSMSSVYQSQSNLLLAEVIVAPILLVLVFLGAYGVGLRVASPIELARQRQMEFTASASHELRTPLSVIEAQTELALRQERDQAWYRTAFTRVDVESKRMRRLVEDLLWLARYDTAGRRPAFEHVDMGVLAQTAVDRFQSVAETRRLSLSASVDGTSTAVTAPPEWLDHLLGVLLDNACRYTPEGGTVTVRVLGQRDRVRIAVDDSGPGIAAEHRARIFERFYRATERAGGSGLGLAIGDAIVRGTGGRWEIGTAPEGGASMAVVWQVSIHGERLVEDMSAEPPLVGDVAPRTPPAGHVPPPPPGPPPGTREGAGPSGVAPDPSAV